MLWSEYMKNLIDASSHESDLSTWYTILHLGINIYWGKVHSFAISRNSDKKMVEMIAHDLCITFIDTHVQR
jgi:hypothetical protein